MSLTAVIYISDIQDSPEQAVKSVIRNRDIISGLYFVYPAHNDLECQFYKDWEEDKAILQQHEGFTLDFISVLDVQKDIKTDFVLKLHPYCNIAKGGLQQLFKQAKSQVSLKKSHFGIYSGTKFSSFNFWYGYLLVMSFFMFLWSRWEQLKLYYHTDAQIYAVKTIGNHRYLDTSETKGIAAYFFNPETAQRYIPENPASSVVMPPVENQGRAYVWSYIRDQTLFRATWFWWVPFFKLWMISYLIYWLSTLYAVLETMRICVLMYYSPFGVFNIARYSLVIVCGTHWLITAYILSREYSFPHKIYLTFAMPFYILTFPFVLIYVRCIGGGRNF